MNRYLVCTLLVINAIPAQAAQAEWCKGYTGCESFTSVTDTLWITAAAQQEAEDKKRQVVEEAKKRRQQEELDNVPNTVQIIAMTTDILNNNKNIDEQVKSGYNAEDEAIAEVNAQDAKNLAALLEACKTGSVAQCAEHEAILNGNYERSLKSSRCAAQQGMRTVKRAELAKKLEQYKDEIVSAYAEMKEVAVQEQADITPLNEKRFKATLICDEGNACNEQIEAMDQALAACKEAAQNKRRDAKYKLDNAWKNYIAARDQLNDVTDLNAMVKSFPRKYSVTPTVVVMTEDAQLAVVTAPVEVNQQEASTRSVVSDESTPVVASAEPTLVQAEKSVESTQVAAPVETTVVKEEKAAEAVVAETIPAATETKSEELPKDSAQ